MRKGSQGGSVLNELLLYIAVVGILAAILMPYLMRLERTVSNPATVQQLQQQQQNYITSKITYIRDSRTNPPLCFAYYRDRGGMANSGPALTEVPCEAVSKFLPSNEQ